MKSKRTTPIANANNPVEAFQKIAYWFRNGGWPYILGASPSREPYVVALADGEIASALITAQVDGQTKKVNFEITSSFKIPEHAIQKIQTFIDQVNSFALARIELLPERKRIAAIACIQLTEAALEDVDIDRAITAACETIDHCAQPILSIIYGNETVGKAIENFKLAMQTTTLPELDDTDGNFTKMTNALKDLSSLKKTNNEDLRQSPIANVNNLCGVFNKAIEWIEETGASYFVSSCSTDPLLMTYRRTQNANFWVVISLDKEEGLLDFTVSNGLKIPESFIPKVREFLKAINEIEITPLELHPRYSEIRTSLAIELSEHELEDDDIADAFAEVCKEIDDCTLPLLEMIHGGKTVADAVADYLEKKKISNYDWYAFNMEVGARKQIRVNPH